MGLADGYLDQIKKFEGYRPKAYWDQKQWSIGYGSRAQGPNETIDETTADQRLRQEIAAARQRVEGFAPNLSEGQRAALTSLTYNAGDQWMRSGLGSAVQRGDWADAQNRFLQYNKAGGVELPGLVSRRQAEASWLGGPSQVADASPPSPSPSSQPSLPGYSMQPTSPAPFSLDNWLTSPLFQMGASVLGADNIGQGLTQGAQNANSLAINRLKMQSMQDEWQQKQQMRELYGRVFPNGSPNMEHPLLKGVTPEIATLAATYGPDHGLDALRDYQMKRAASQIALEAEAQKRSEMMKMVDGFFGGAPAAGAPPPSPSPAPGTPPPQAPMAPMAAMPGVSVDFSRVAQPQQPQTPQMQPAPASAMMPNVTPAPAAGDARALVLQDPTLRRVMGLNIALGDTKGAMTAYEKALERATGPEIAGQTELAKEQAKNISTDAKTTKAARDLWGLLDQTERAANALGPGRLDSASSPSLDYDGWAATAYRNMSPQAYNDRLKLMTYVNNMIVQARETQRGLGQLTEGEQATLEKAYTTMKHATSGKEFYNALDTVRSVVAQKIPERQGYAPRWITEAEEAQKPKPAVNLRDGVPGIAVDFANVKDMVPPPKGAGRQVDRIDASLEGSTVYDNERGKWGIVLNGEFVPKSRLLKPNGLVMLERARVAQEAAAAELARRERRSGP